MDWRSRTWAMSQPKLRSEKVCRHSRTRSRCAMRSSAAINTVSFARACPRSPCAMKVGFTPNSPEAVKAKQWLTDRYHAPSDDLNQPVDMEAAGKFEDVLSGIAVMVANRDARPQW